MRSIERTKTVRGQKSERGEGTRREWKSADSPLFKTLLGRWLFRQQVTTCWHLEFLDCYDGLQFRERFKIETTTIIGMLDLDNLPQKKLGLLAVSKKSNDPLDV